MSNLVLITGSCRENGNSRILADSFEAAAKELGHSVKRIDATKMDTGICHACMTCFSTGKACTFGGDFNDIADDIINADGIIIAAPVYWYSFPAAIKAVIDKFFSLFIGGYDFKGKKAALISCCEESTPETFDGMTFEFDKSFTLTGAEIVGKVLVNSVNEAGTVKDTDGPERAAALAKLF